MKKSKEIVVNSEKNRIHVGELLLEIFIRNSLTLGLGMFAALGFKTFQANLARFAAQDSFVTLMQTAFGKRLDLHQLGQLRQQWLQGDFSGMPEIQVLSQSELGTAQAAYGAERIFISSDFLARGTEQQVLAVLLEEYGHSLDPLLNGATDSLGDEGEIFSRLVMGRPMSEELLAGLRSQNDRGFLVLDGVSVPVEYADLFGDDNDNIITGTQGDDNIFGNGGNDVLDDGDDHPDLFINGQDSLVGGEGDDRLTTHNGQDTLEGGNGNDRLTMDSINILSSNLYGGLGDDTLALLSSQASYLAGGAGNDTYEISVTASGYFIEEFAGEGRDTVDFSNFSAGVLFGTGDFLENIVSGTGNDILSGGTGNNNIFGNNGNDSINSAAGNDTLDGGFGDDTLRGGLGNDFFSAAQGNDYLFGEGGDDSLYGGVGNDTYWIDGDVEGGIVTIGETSDGGIDEINFSNTTGKAIAVNLSAIAFQVLTPGLQLNNYTLESIEKITGGSGNDTLTGNNQDNIIRGGDGNDFIDGRFGSDTMDGGNNIDTLDVSFFSGAYVLDMTTGITNFIGEIAINFENINTGAGDDSLTGSSIANVINSGFGNDSVLGASGNDTLNGNGGVDYLNGGAGNDRLIGETETDVYQVDADVDLGTDTIVETAAGGIDVLDFRSTTTKAITINLATIGGQTVSAGVAFATTLDNIEYVYGGALNDSITGNSLNNYFLGGTGNDTLNGGLGIDYLSGGVGNDRLVGGDGTDVYVMDADVDLGADIIVETITGGVDVVDFRNTTTKAITLNLGVFTNQLVATGVNISLLSSSSPLAASIEYAYGGSLGDNLTGNSLNNYFLGGAGNDTLNGGIGSDVLNGGAGNDSLTGGTGTGIDQFIYSGAALTGVNTVAALLGRDTITDFGVAVDKISLSKAMFTGITSAAGVSLGNNFASVATDGAAATSAAMIVYSTGTGNLFYNPNGIAAGFDVNGGNFAVLNPLVVGGLRPNLTVSNFVVVA
jgi:Ca2+-binding RTX toxin-like protein